APVERAHHGCQGGIIALLLHTVEAVGGEGGFGGTVAVLVPGTGGAVNHEFVAAVGGPGEGTVNRRLLVGVLVSDADFEVRDLDTGHAVSNVADAGWADTPRAAGGTAAGAGGNVDRAILVGVGSK